MALCQKALFRYGDALRSLNQLLAQYGSSLTPAERSTLQASIVELSALVGSIELVVLPPDATVTVDGRTVQLVDGKAHADLDVGEHLLTVKAPGHVPHEQTIRVAGGGPPRTMNLALKPQLAELAVSAQPPQAVIKMDGKRLALGSWSGSVVPGRHVIRIEAAGYVGSEQVVELSGGQRISLRGTPGPATHDSSATQGGPPASHEPRGWFGLLSLSTLAVVSHPVGFEPESESQRSGGGLGLRAGYRLLTPLGVEGEVTTSHHEIPGQCNQDAPDSCPSTPTAVNYTLDTRRFGSYARLFSNGRVLRFVSSAGAGIVSHDFRAFQRHAVGLDVYFLAEAGLQLNWQHGLFELVAVGMLDSASNIKVGRYAPYANGAGIQMLGLRLGIGWSEWTPSSP